MNKRIHVLAEQAQQYAEWTTPQGLEWLPAFKEKFAELIVRECAKIAEDTQKFYDEHNDSQVNTEIWTMIKLHFGVEETSIKIGSRIKVISGFNVGAKGTVSYIEPSGKLWVRRDGASSDVYYHPEELIGVSE